MGGTDSKQWVVLAAGSKGWENYRHQADVCHAYQVMRQNGIPDEQIVVMMYDDIAYNKENPDKGKIINVPNGPNVYTGVPKDYTGEEVSAENFLAVLRGDSSAVRKSGSKKVIQSGNNDSIFIYLSDHGGHSTFAFPNSTLYAHDLINTVNSMSEDGKFSKMVIYMEACHSGSMLESLTSSNVYAVAACNPYESSYACFKDNRINAFLSDVFTACWLQHTETSRLNMTSFEAQFRYLKEKVSKTVRTLGMSQTPCNYGDGNMRQLMLSELLGQSDGSVRGGGAFQPTSFQVSDVVDAVDITLIIQANRIKKGKSPREKQALERQLNDLIKKRNAVDEALKKIAVRTKTPQALREKREVTHTYEFKRVAEHFRVHLFDWEKEAFVVTRSHLQVLVNLCECGLRVESITGAITHVSRQITF